MSKLSFSVRLGGLMLWLCLSLCHSTTICPREEVCNEVCWNTLMDTLEGLEETPSEVEAQLHRLLETENVFFGSDSVSIAASGFGFIRAGFKHLESLRSSVSSKPEVFTGFAALAAFIGLSWAVVVVYQNGAGSRSRSGSPPPLPSNTTTKLDIKFRDDNLKKGWGSIPFSFSYFGLTSKGWSFLEIATHLMP